MLVLAMVTGADLNGSTPATRRRLGVTQSNAFGCSELKAKQAGERMLGQKLPGMVLAASDRGFTGAVRMVSSAGWDSYHNPVTGLSFRYPPSLRIQERDPRSFGLPDAEEITELVGDTKVNPGTVVLRFIVNRGEMTPETAAAKVRTIRERYATDTDPRESLETLQLDGHEALLVVGCGRAACHWSIRILQPHECTILSLLAGADSDEAVPPPHDGIFPLLSIIQSVHFDVDAASVQPTRLDREKKHLADAKAKSIRGI